MKLMRKNAFAPILILLALLLAGCGGDSAPKPSGSFTTNSIYAFMKAVQDESGSVTTTVQLRDGVASTAAYLYLSSGEVLYSSLDKPPQQYMSFSSDLFGNSLDLSQNLKTMSARDLYMDFVLFVNVVAGKPEYFVSEKPVSGAATVRAYVDFERSGQVMTGASSIDLPPAFQISAPASAASIARATPIVLTWTGVDAATTMRLDAAAACDDGTRNSWNYNIGPDTGTATVNSASFLPATASPTATCLTAFMLQRVKTGGVSTQFAFGSFEGIQKRTVQFTVTP
ncbi:MAG: hypothetical protein HZB47_11820 [Nitrosomonadales bacterium]|nr:hypothetical protein [Nitrosomonadales bacterium]